MEKYNNLYKYRKTDGFLREYTRTSKYSRHCASQNIPITSLNNFLYIIFHYNNIEIKHRYYNDMYIHYRTFEIYPILSPGH